MRELKFRVWDKIHDKYREPMVYDILNEKIVVRFPIETLKKGELIIEQYTGLKDKNGKEIYEGDIVEYTTCYYGNEKSHRKVVEWEEWDSDDFGEPHNLGYRDLDGGEEVIGNIHENPELLEEE